MGGKFFKRTALPVVDGLSLLPFKAFWCWPLTKNHWQQLLIFHLSLQPKLCYNATDAVCAASKHLWKCLLLCLYVHMYPKASVTMVTSAKGGTGTNSAQEFLPQNIHSQRKLTTANQKPFTSSVGSKIQPHIPEKCQESSSSWEECLGIARGGGSVVEVNHSWVTYIDSAELTFFF